MLTTPLTVLPAVLRPLAAMLLYELKRYSDSSLCIDIDSIGRPVKLSLLE